MIRRLLTTTLVAFCVILFAQGAYGQNTEQLRNRLALPHDATGARVAVTERGNAPEVIKAMESKQTLDKVSGYRVRIFFDNKQNARGSATATKSRFDEMFPDIQAQLSYENPYWKVTVGNCLSNEEAIILWGRIKGAFDRAFVVREEIHLSSFAEQASM